MTRLQLVVATLALATTGTAIAEAPAILPSQSGSGAPRRRPPLDQLNDSFGAPIPQPDRPPPPPPFRVPTEVVLHGKELVGRWQCKGVRIKGDGSSSPYVATITSKPELGGAWIQSSLIETGAVPNPGNYVDYRTYDATAKQWTRLQLTGLTAHAQATSLGETAGTWTWTGSMSSPTGTLQIRDFEKRDGATYKLWGEALLGGTWQKRYELTCQR